MSKPGLSIESRRTKISSGSLPSPRIQHLAGWHPFTQQLDVIFPSAGILETALSALGTAYARGKLWLSDLIEGAEVGLFRESGSGLSILSTSADVEADDIWCVDPRGLLTLCVGRDTYARLGLVGRRLLFKNRDEQHVIHIALHSLHIETAGNRAKTKAALKAWEARREADGFGPWDVLFSPPNADTLGLFLSAKISEQQFVNVAAQCHAFPNVYIPTPTLTPRPAPYEEDLLEDWNNDMASLFEWVGMACLGSQRLNANDRVDPYIALYAPPSPSRIGSVTHLRWRGFLGPGFAQSVIAVALAHVGALAPRDFVSIASHAISASPVSYISPQGKGAEKNETPFRVPRADGEDTWCAVFTPSIGEENVEDIDGGTCIGKWVMVESLGQWDTRWG